MIPSAGTINEVDIADGTTYTIDAKGNNVNLFQNGEKIVFQGENSELDLINTGTTDGKFTLYANLNPSSINPTTPPDIYGIVRVSSTPNGLTIDNNDATIRTIGQDSTHRLKEFIVDDTEGVFRSTQQCRHGTTLIRHRITLTQLTFTY
ncbi:hypothetical protein [Rickettsia bellii]|uniref:hypothetical protein n=1 Tax=Rickettsia bellii TaxID=33990 RepID=UPI0000DB0F7F|nr:hypothetical protein [Rickettsia bellii]